ncbi:MAG: alanine--glyoxylate aminotransferase family protein [Methanosphaera sp.]|uniref:pyridoxal-phosphate-dependent aminotransferase family protein n=1 Tax=Methanosphaera sp. ISO3-F5 TaxID=1452353 RepID=UPI002B25E7D9|nr:alanine--glyoxylate aminotransferase family protein [Methanosphaera sp. ISO3-F5]MBR0471943.1 alanine--glyoxylate aminotransferase family protein [Methanosphaera sp.]WQH63287.1 alanine--glyoxylate aminotransferase family protein [Methanosphaera sp. ISO3-F5]
MEDILLMIPGPTTVPKRVLDAMAQPITNHRGAAYGEILDETTAMLSEVFQTDNKSYLLTGSGTSAMEAAIANIVEKGDKVINVVGGKFGERLQQLTEVFGGESIEVTVPWGQAADPAEIKRVVEENDDAKALTMIHNESSTAVVNPIKEVGEIMKDHDTLFVVDTVSSLAGDTVKVDEYGLDICLSGSQKCLAAPPGMSMLTLSDDAWNVVDKVESPTYYLDMKKMRKSGAKSQTPYTPSVSMTYAMNEALSMVLEEGLDARIKRHHTGAEATREAAKALGLELFAREGDYSNTLTGIKMPEGVTDKQLRGTMRDKYQIELAGGQDHLSGNIFRIGHMGITGLQELAMTFTCLEMTLKEFGFDFEAGAGVAALQDVYLKN